MLDRKLDSNFIQQKMTANLANESKDLVTVKVFVERKNGLPRKSRNLTKDR
jgi:hypothetical protein